MSSKDDHIAALEDEVRAARETIKILSETIKELSKNRQTTTVYKTYPYWWDGRTWYYQQPYYGGGTITWTNQVGSNTNGLDITFNRPDDDDGDGVRVSNVA